MDQNQLGEYIEFLAKTKNLSELTIYRYAEWIKDLDLTKLSQDYINSYVQKKGNHSQVRGALLNLLEMTGLKRNYDMPPKKTGRTKKRIIRDISSDEIKIVAQHLYSKSFRNGLVFDLTYQGALRRFEIPTIRINSFKWLSWLDNMDKPCKLIIKGKGDKERTVLINASTTEMIFNHYFHKYQLHEMDKIIAFANSPSFLFTKKNKPMNEWDVWKVINKGSTDVLGRKIRPHELRHARASELMKMGVPIRDIKNYLGHSSLATTEIYLHSDETSSINNIEDMMIKNQ